MPSKPPHAVALIACWTSTFVIMSVIAVLDAGLSAWLQGTIYLLAGVLFGLGFASVLRFFYFRDRSGYRQGIYYIVAGWVFAGHAYYRIREHRADLTKEESQLAPVVDAVRHFRAERGVLPKTADEIPDLPPHLPPFRYEPDGETFHLSFRHDVFVAHRFDSATDAWHDEARPP